jgi:para-nitrobenzyl esterase
MGGPLMSIVRSIGRPTGMASGVAVLVTGFAALTGAMSTAGAATRADGMRASGPVVMTQAGPVRGLSVDGMHQFLGVPYAAPPVGRLRWRPPQPAAHHRALLNATMLGPECAQPATFFGAASTSEDCLQLNVYAPAASTGATKRPVLVWIHGGALFYGSSRQYDPRPLVRRGTVVVTVNYRLGALGFLAHPALSAEAGGSSGDYGLMDQQAALRWVRHNINSFGGNAHNVTIDGESAGGLSVLAQVASPTSAGLFNRAIVQSGGYNLRQTSQATANAAGSLYAAAVGCSKQTAACLRSRPVAQLLANQKVDVYGYLPNIDGRILPRSIGHALATGRFNKVPMINGTTSDEARIFVAIMFDLAGRPLTAARYTEAIASLLRVSPTTAVRIAALYPQSAYPSPDLALAAVGTDGIFACPSRQITMSLSRYEPTYAYEFADRHAPQRYLPPVSFPYGAYHAAELQYLFDLPTAPVPGTLTQTQQQLARAMQQDWTAFAATGTLNRTNTTAWPVYRRDTERFERFSPPTPTVASDFASRHHCRFWSGK